MYFKVEFMRAFPYIFFFLVMSTGAKAQQNYFIYVQADNKQPFFVKVDDKVLSSSASGYIVIPKLSTGKYSLTVGFPKNIFPEQTLALTVGNADAGYLLKNFGDKGWGLYNIQTTELTMNGGAPQKSEDTDDAFTAALSGAANTTLTKPKKPAPNADLMEVVVSSVIEKISGTNTAEGSSMIYTDRTGSTIDTIRVFIPAEGVTVTKEPVTNTAEVKTEPVKDTKFLDIELQNPNTKAADTALAKPALPPETAVATSSSVKIADKPVVSFNSDCRANAGDDDFLKIRKKMAAATDEDAMVDAARKSFKAKCYSTEQVKNLGLLFLTDGGKYKFFDAAYPHTSDTQNFGSLQAQLHDEYYVNRFRAMVRN